MFGTLGGSFFTGSAFMAVQATGAMAIIIDDTPAVHSGSDPARALYTLSILTGVVMLTAGFLRLGSLLRFVSNAVMVGFLSAVGVNIVLGSSPTSPATTPREPTGSSALSTPSSIPASSMCSPWPWVW